MTTLLWSSEKLSGLCGHGNPEVKQWAAERLYRLYPKEARPLMELFLNDRDTWLASLAAAYFCDYADKNFAEILLAAFPKSSGGAEAQIGCALATIQEERFLAAAQKKYPRMPDDDPAGFIETVQNVARLKTPEARRYIEAALFSLDTSDDLAETVAAPLFIANIDAGADIGRLLTFAYSNKSSRWIAVLLSSIAIRAGAACTEDAMTGNKAGMRESNPLIEDMEDALILLNEAGCTPNGKYFEKLLRKRRYDEVIEEAERSALSMLNAKRLESGEDDYIRWQSRRDDPFFHCSALTAMRETLPDSPKGHRDLIAVIAVIILSKLVESRNLIALNPETVDIDSAFDLFFEDRPDACQDDAIMDLLAGKDDVKSVARRAIMQLELHPYSQANGRAIRLAGRFIDEEIANGLLATHVEDHDLQYGIVKVVKSLGARAIPLVHPFFENNIGQGTGMALHILEDIPTEESADLILAHWSRLWVDYKEPLLGAVAGIGDKRFIPLLKPELREGEFFEAETFRLLCLVNNVNDPELDRVKRELEAREQYRIRLQKAIAEADMLTLLKEPIEASLKCRSCGNAYHYTIEKVFVTSDGKDTVIQDKVACKKCGALDHYVITDEGMMAITARLLFLPPDIEEYKREIDAITVIPIRSTSAFGEGMSITDLVEKYEKKLKKKPENPELLIGLANALGQVKRREDATPFYERAIRSDPLAVEGYVSLGEYALDKGDPEGAFTHYSRAAEIMDKGRYYRVNADLDQFREALLDKLMFVEEKLGRQISRRKGEAAGGGAQLSSSQTVGRNHPCPCGSGKKYKKCCLPRISDESVEPETRRQPAPDPVFRSLFKKLMRYVEQTKFRRDFLQATGIYWETEPREPIMLPERASNDQGQFHDWFINDYRAADGKTMLEGFRDLNMKTLSAEEMRLADALEKSYISVYEVQDVRRGESLTIRDIFTGETMVAMEVSGSYSAVKWDLLMVRVYKMDGICRFGGNGQMIPRGRIESLKAYLERERGSFEAQTGRAGWPAFLKERGFMIGQFIDKSAAEPPVMFTEEMHRIICAKAHFKVIDFATARKLVAAEYDFGDEEEMSDGGARFSWIKRGASKEWEMGNVKKEDGMIATSSMIHPSGRMTFTVLGMVELHHDRMLLECMSKERLTRGKKRLLDLLGGSVKHRIDEFEDIHAAMGRDRGSKEKPRPAMDKESRAMMLSIMQRYMSEWADKEIPALGGKTPREAVATGEGRKTVISIIKEMENAEARKKRDGEPFIDIGPLRRDLGIGMDEG